MTMDDIYNYCLHTYPDISGKNMSDAHVHEVCQTMSRIANTTHDFMDTLIDLELRAPVDLAVPLMGYAAPVINTCTLLLNIVVVIVLTRRRLRSPTNVILVCIAICDTFTGLLPLPEYLYTYTYGGYHNYPSMSWCIVLTYVSNFAPKVLHTIALWSTALLAFHRYVGVAQLTCESWFCRYKGVLSSIVAIIIVSLVCHCFQLFTVLRPITVIGKGVFTPDGLQLIDTCYQTLVTIREVEYFSYVYTWIRLTFAQVLPCLMMLLFNVCLLRVTYRSYTYRRRLIAGHRVSEVAETRKTIRLSMMLLLITTFTCIFELFVDVSLILNFAQIYSKHNVVDPDMVGRVLLVSNFLLFLSFPLNFFFMLGLSNSFRRVLTYFVKQKFKRKVTPQPVVHVCDGNGVNNFTLADMTLSSSNQ